MEHDSIRSLWDGFGAGDITTPAMRRAIREWFDLYFDGKATDQEDPCQKIPYAVVHKITRAAFSEYGWEAEGYAARILRALDAQRKKAMQMAPDMVVVVNADDSLSTFLAMDSGNEYVTYGISSPYFEEDKDSKEIREGQFCKRCGEKMQYRFYHYSQLGDYYCPKCGFRRPGLDFDAVDIKARGGLSFKVEGRRIQANYRGFYNIYNILAAYSAARTAGMELTGFDRVLRNFNPQNGRNELFHIQGTRVLLNLAKNPAGFNQNISAVMEDTSQKDLIIVINDNAQDGTDISWLWDVDFDRFGEDNIHSITVSGIRCQDMRLRLKYVDIQAELVEDVKTAIEKRLKDGCKNLYVLVNYTALYSTHNILKNMEK